MLDPTSPTGIYAFHAPTRQPEDPPVNTTCHPGIKPTDLVAVPSADGAISYMQRQVADGRRYGWVPLTAEQSRAASLSLRANKESAARFAEAAQKYWQHVVKIADGVELSGEQLADFQRVRFMLSREHDNDLASDLQVAKRAAEARAWLLEHADDSSKLKKAEQTVARIENELAEYLKNIRQKAEPHHKSLQALQNAALQAPYQQRAAAALDVPLSGKATPPANLPVRW